MSAYTSPPLDTNLGSFMSKKKTAQKKFWESMPVTTTNVVGAFATSFEIWDSCKLRKWCYKAGLFVGHLKILRSFWTTANFMLFLVGFKSDLDWDFGRWTGSVYRNSIQILRIHAIWFQYQTGLECTSSPFLWSFYYLLSKRMKFTLN